MQRDGQTHLRGDSEFKLIWTLFSFIIFLVMEMKTIWLATNNLHKLEEIKKMLKDKEQVK